MASVSVSSKVGDYTINVTVTLTAASMRDDPTPEMLLGELFEHLKIKGCVVGYRFLRLFYLCTSTIP